jgi:pantoate--beta-alanine ligase
MQIIKTIQELRNYLDSQQQTIGFVPTMGALHEGHLSLIKQSKQENKLTICSIFVNPTQFNDPKDFEKYPITLETDIEKLISVYTDILFLPTVAEMYRDGTIQVKRYDIGFLDTVLDGEFRHGHFNGVCTVVHKLLNAVKPNKMYLGEKDFQQCLVLKQLVQQENIPTQVITCPTLREMNGLAMSSRNQRLSATGKEAAKLIYECLNKIKDEQSLRSFEAIKLDCLEQLEANGFKTEYIYLAQAETLKPLIDFVPNTPMVVLIASHFEGVRLIDNLRVR